MICPDCKGQGIEIANHVHYANGRGAFNVPMKCLRCEGDGNVPDAMKEWMARGRIMRDRRVNGTPYRSLMVEAKRLGISVMELSRMEQGKVEPKL